jgi:hypothetical protein
LRRSFLDVTAVEAKPGIASSTKMSAVCNMLEANRLAIQVHDGAAMSGMRRFTPERSLLIGGPLLTLRLYQHAHSAGRSPAKAGD